MNGSEICSPWNRKAQSGVSLSNLGVLCLNVREPETSIKPSLLYVSGTACLRCSQKKKKIYPTKRTKEVVGHQKRLIFPACSVVAAAVAVRTLPQ